PTDWQDPVRVEWLAARLNERAEQAAGAGIRVGYHNHHFELAARHDERSALELFAEHLDPRVILEIDTYWAVVGGADITSLLTGLGDRVKLVHLKDGDLAQDPAGQLPLGTGKMPLTETLAGASVAEYGVIEFDEYGGGVFVGLAPSLNQLLCQASRLSPTSHLASPRRPQCPLTTSPAPSASASSVPAPSPLST